MHFDTILLLFFRLVLAGISFRYIGRYFANFLLQYQVIPPRIPPFILFSVIVLLFFFPSPRYYIASISPYLYVIYMALCIPLSCLLYLFTSSLSGPRSKAFLVVFSVLILRTLFSSMGVWAYALIFLSLSWRRIEHNLLLSRISLVKPKVRPLLLSIILFVLACMFLFQKTSEISSSRSLDLGSDLYQAVSASYSYYYFLNSELSTHLARVSSFCSFLPFFPYLDPSFCNSVSPDQLGPEFLGAVPLISTIGLAYGFLPAITLYVSWGLAIAFAYLIAFSLFFMSRPQSRLSLTLCGVFISLSSFFVFAFDSLPRSLPLALGAMVSALLSRLLLTSMLCNASSS